MEEMLTYCGFHEVREMESPESSLFTPEVLTKMEEGYASISLIVEAQK